MEADNFFQFWFLLQHHWWQPTKFAKPLMCPGMSDFSFTCNVHESILFMPPPNVGKFKMLFSCAHRLLSWPRKTWPGPLIGMDGTDTGRLYYAQCSSICFNDRDDSPVPTRLSLSLSLPLTLPLPPPLLPAARKGRQFGSSAGRRETICAATDR